MVSPQPNWDGVAFASSLAYRHLGVPPTFTSLTSGAWEASQTRTANTSVSGPGRTDIIFRRHLNSRQTDPSHCPPTPTPSYLRHRQQIPRGRNPARARTHRVRTAQAEDATAASAATAVRRLPAAASARSRENLLPDGKSRSPALPRPLLPPKPKSLLLLSHPTRSEKKMTHNLTKHRGAEPICRRRRLPHAPRELSRYYVFVSARPSNSPQDAARASPLGNTRSRETYCTLLKRREAGLHENDWEFFGGKGGTSRPAGISPTTRFPTHCGAGCQTSRWHSSAPNLGHVLKTASAPDLRCLEPGAWGKFKKSTCLFSCSQAELCQLAKLHSGRGAMGPPIVTCLQ